MPTVETRELIIPSPGEFTIVWEAFFVVVSAIATYRADGGERQRFGELSIHAATLLRSDAASEAMESLAREMAEDPKEKISLGILYEEMQYIAWKYREVPAHVDMDESALFEKMGVPEQFSADPGDPGVPADSNDSAVVDDIDIVTGSIKSILDKLPNWVRKAVDAILEALKLSRGGVDSGYVAAVLLDQFFCS